MKCRPAQVLENYKLFYFILFFCPCPSKMGLLDGYHRPTAPIFGIIFQRRITVGGEE
jgi:hypothetical protein